jgi:hypothetical protein
VTQNLHPNYHPYFYLLLISRVAVWKTLTVRTNLFYYVFALAFLLPKSTHIFCFHLRHVALNINSLTDDRVHSHKGELVLLVGFRLIQVEVHLFFFCCFTFLNHDMLLFTFKCVLSQNRGHEKLLQL